MIRRLLEGLASRRPPLASPDGPVLLTGAAGAVATMVRPFLAEAGLRLRLSDVRPVESLLADESFVRADLRDARAVESAVDGCRGIVHLGGIGKDREMTELITVDMTGTANILEAARAAGVPRVVLASSMHVLGRYRRTEPVHALSPPRPDSRYAVAKLFAEQAGALYAAKHGVRVLCLRLGSVAPTRDAAEPGSWIAPEDVAALIRLGLEHPGVDFAVVHAVAPYDGDDEAQRDVATHFGYTFRHRGTTWADALADAERHFWFDPPAARWRGGVFVTRDGEPS